MSRNWEYLQEFSSESALRVKIQIDSNLKKKSVQSEYLHSKCEFWIQNHIRQHRLRLLPVFGTDGKEK